jgi:hypothetical protein
MVPDSKKTVKRPARLLFKGRAISYIFWHLEATLFLRRLTRSRTGSTLLGTHALVVAVNMICTRLTNSDNSLPLFGKSRPDMLTTLLVCLSIATHRFRVDGNDVYTPEIGKLVLECIAEEPLWIWSTMHPVEIVIISTASSLPFQVEFGFENLPSKILELTSEMVGNNSWVIFHKLARDPYALQWCFSKPHFIICSVLHERVPITIRGRESEKQRRASYLTHHCFKCFQLTRPEWPSTTLAPRVPRYGVQDLFRLS